MNSRRELLTTLGVGVAGLTGCLSSSSQSESPASEPTNETEPEEPVEDETTPQKNTSSLEGQVPLDGLGAYQEKLEQNPASEETLDWAENFLNGNTTPTQQAETLAEEITEDNYTTLLNAIHRKNPDNENTVVVNQNWSFTSDSEPIHEIYTVENGQLQSAPIIVDLDPETTGRQIHQPGQTGPEYLKDLRDSTDWAQTIPQDWSALEERIAPGNQEEKRNVREGYVQHWSAALFGTGPDDTIIPYDGESSNVVFDGLYHDGDTEVVVELNNAYRDSELFGSDQIVSAQYTEEGWEFQAHSEYEMGEKLPGEQ